MKLSIVSDRYRPDVLALEEPAHSRKGDAVREWLAWAEEHAAERSLRHGRAVPRQEEPGRPGRGSRTSLSPSLRHTCRRHVGGGQSEARALPKFVAVERGLRALEHLERLDRSAA